MAVVVLIVSLIFGLIMMGLSIRANARFRQEEKLPMQWTISRSRPLSETVIWSAPRILALSFVPALAIGVLVLITIGAMTFTPRHGQEGVLLPAVILIGCVFVAVHVLHLWLIGKTLHRDGN